MLALPSEDLLWRLAAVLALAGSLGGLWWLDADLGRVGERLRARLVMGVPWGTLAVVSGVLGFYLTAQHGFDHWYRPVTIAYSSWSYLYPLGWLTAAFAHDGAAHLVGNLAATLVVMPLAEHAFGHYPTRRGSQSFGSLPTNPWARALLVFPAGVVVVGLLTSLFSWGPIIGFSGVVFAAIGFALVRYPLAAVVALVAREGVDLAYGILLDPVVVREASSRFVRPGWAGIAVQGHALGLFVGAGLGLLVLYRDGLVALPGLGSRADDRPPAHRLWLGTVLVGLSLGLWALWWYRGSDTYVLYRAAGLAFVVAVGLVVTAAVATSDRGLFGDEAGLTRRQAAALVLLAPLLTMSLVAVPLNLSTVTAGSVPADAEPIEVRDYAVFYAEDVPNGMVGVVDVSLFGETTQVNTSGVVVVSERRHVWTREVSKGELAHGGTRRVFPGGPGWREVVVAQRRGWSASGGPAAYKVWLWRGGRRAATGRVAFTSEPATAAPVVAGRNVTIAPVQDGFELRVTRGNRTLGTAPVPGENETVTAGGLRFVRDGRDVLATYQGTRVTVARREEYK